MRVTQVASGSVDMGCSTADGPNLDIVLLHLPPDKMPVTVLPANRTQRLQMLPDRFPGEGAVDIASRSD